MAWMTFGSLRARDTDRPAFVRDVSLVAAEWASRPVARAMVIVVAAATNKAIAAETRVFFVVMFTP
jgi:hypothetical protein